ncbi:MAG: hypothetical protein KQH53_08625 [Desulfarculaceae bacterium]|nr:hypothetical protein [Desulfarculaceae bacterium]
MERTIGIIGGRVQNTTPAACKAAEAIGSILAQRGFSIVCGGDNGAPEAACKGCQEAGGTTIGILKGNVLGGGNPYLDYTIPTSMDLARNDIIIWSSYAVIAFEGHFGTATEISLCSDIGKPLILIGDFPLLNLTQWLAPNRHHFPVETVDPVTVVDIIESLL